MNKNFYKSGFGLLAAVLLLVGCAEQNNGNIEGTPVESRTEQETPETTEYAGNETITEPEERESELMLDTESIAAPEPEPYTITLAFAGDINLDENWPTTQYLNSAENGIYDCIDPSLIEELKSADIFMLNNEFTYSTGGSPIPGKAYTFRADPSRVSVVESLGTDIVLLANNHVYDYGKEALVDTLNTLTEAGIPYVGAGMNLQEACNPYYFETADYTIAYVAASCAEKNKMTPQATDTEPGILRCYDENLFLEAIAEAKEHADYVVASVHFGTEYDHQVTDRQRELAYEMIDAGADAVIGSHAHVIQGMEYYNGKPIMYNLGNFWFNKKDLYSCVVELELSVHPSEENPIRFENMIFLPLTQKNIYTRWETEGAKREEILEFEQEISYGVQIDEAGYVTVAQ